MILSEPSPGGQHSHFIHLHINDTLFFIIFRFDCPTSMSPPRLVDLLAYRMINIITNDSTKMGLRGRLRTQSYPTETSANRAVSE